MERQMETSIVYWGIIVIMENKMEITIMGSRRTSLLLGTPLVPFCAFYFGVSLLKLNSRNKGTLIIMGLLGNLVTDFYMGCC